MTQPRTLLLTALAMIPLAANSWLCRAALRDTAIDAATFTSVRLISGALMLWALVWLTRKWSAGQRQLALGARPVRLRGLVLLCLPQPDGRHRGAAPVRCRAGDYDRHAGLARGERLDGVQVAGVALAFGGLLGLLWPGWSAPPLGAALMMIGAGIAWGIYSVRGKGAADPIRATAGNFLLTVPMTAVLSLLTIQWASLRSRRVRRTRRLRRADLRARLRALVYRLAPVARADRGDGPAQRPGHRGDRRRAAAREPITLRLVLASGAVLCGIGLVILERQRLAPPE